LHHPAKGSVLGRKYKADDARKVVLIFVTFSPSTKTCGGYSSALRKGIPERISY